MANVWRLIAHHDNAAGVVNLIRSTGQIWIGWGDVGDLRQSSFRSGQDITRKISQVYPTLDNAGLGGPSLWRFYHEMHTGDLVIVSSKGRRQITVEVIGPYEWQPNPGPAPLTGDYLHHRAVRLTNLDPNALFAQAGRMAPGENVRWTLFRCAHAAPSIE